MLTFFFIIHTSFDAFSQHIPNANFAAAIRLACASCIDVSDNLLTPATSLTSLDVSNKNIADLTGIHAFISLTTFKCRQNQLTILPALPNSLTILDCSNNQLTSLPTLPSNLISLDSYSNQLTNLPTLPSSLTRLSCSINQLTNLPTLPINLDWLGCYSNKLTSLPTLPNSLTYLDFPSNQVTSIPTLPNSLTQLICDSNKLTSLPALPNNLTRLYSGNNPLIYLPALPSHLTELDCYGLYLTSLPILPNSLVKLFINANKITCLPNTVLGLQVYNGLTPIPTPPVCTCIVPTAPAVMGTTTCQGNLVTLTTTGCTGTGYSVLWFRATDSTTVTMPIIPSITTDYYAKCQVPVGNAICISPASSNVKVVVIPKNLIISSTTPPPFEATDTIVTNGTITLSVNTTYKAGKSILFNATAENSISITSDSVFLAKIGGCNY